LRRIAASPILQFTNNDDVRSKATIIDANALSIRVDDESGGNYFLYNRAGQISKNEDKGLRTLTAVFDPKEQNVYLKSILTKPWDSIVWTFPEKGPNTMIIPASGTGADAVPIDTNKFEDEDEDANKIKDVVSVGYFIKPDLNRNAT